ncbi:hypothetical protein [Desulfosporosinus sp. OT]|uniref:hypothetical protein n=1 Tax=Desulfosporosinus sp. OT TaxID=913865 RepID=UPI001300C784|nr:hypothetical protein [Desulfosporosinus sp. OT]
MPNYWADHPIRLTILVLGASRNIAVASFSPDFHNEQGGKANSLPRTSVQMLLEA